MNTVKVILGFLGIVAMFAIPISLGCTFYKYKDKFWSKQNRNNTKKQKSGDY